jgi:RNA polymerase sigma-70 factor (ECF subfamily)
VRILGVGRRRKTGDDKAKIGSLADFSRGLRFHGKRRLYRTQIQPRQKEVVMLTQPVSVAESVGSYLPPALGGERPPGESPDAALVAEARAGNVAAYGALVLRHQNRLYTSLFHLCGSRTDAEDATQEAFLLAYVKLSSYSGASAFYTWLYRVAVNAAFTQRRKRRTRSEGERLRSMSENAACPAAECPDERILRVERAKVVQQALASLSEEYRAILVLREIEGFDYDEIAQALGIPVGTLRSRLLRALMELRKVLDRWLG